MQTQADIRRNNETFLNALDFGGEYEKQARDGLDGYTRWRVREGGIQREVMPFEPIQDSDLDQFVDTALPGKIVSMEPDSSAALMVNFRTLPTQHYITSRKYKVGANRVVSPWFQADVEELRSLTIDIRQILNDNAAKDVQHAEDTAFFAAVDRILGAPEQVGTFSMTAMWRRSDSSVTRASLVDMTKIMPSAVSRFNPVKCVTNNITAKELLKFTRNEAGGDWSEKLLRNGWTEDEFLNMKWFVTIKHEIVPHGAFYMFAEDRCLGKAYEYTPPTMFVEKRMFLLNYCLYETIGSTLANPNAVARQDLRVTA